LYFYPDRVRLQAISGDDNMFRFYFPVNNSDHGFQNIIDQISPIKKKTLTCASRKTVLNIILN